MKPKIAILGRPNVGKSTLFNRLVGKKKSLVYDQPGITRDYIYGEFSWDGIDFELLDTGGLELHSKNRIQQKMSKQALSVVEQADLLICVLDGQTGITALDREWVAFFRKHTKPALFIVNKIDNPKKVEWLNDFYELGLTPLIPLSAETGWGMSGLLEALAEQLRPLSKPDEAKDDATFSIALIGRPNVGKSTLTNRLIGYDRSIVDEMAGTTRDPIDTYLNYEGETWRLIDTAGIRKRGKASEVIEKFSVIKSIHSIERAQATLILLDGSEGMTDQDGHVIGEAFKRSKLIIFLVNKWDVPNKKFNNEEFLEELRYRYPFCADAPVIFISAKTGKNVEKIFPTIARVKAQYEKRVETSKLNDVFQYIVENHPLPVHAGKNIKIFFATQIDVSPPTFVVFSNYPSKIHFSYKRYLTNSLREAFEFKEVPIQIIYRKKN